MLFAWLYGREEKTSRSRTDKPTDPSEKNTKNHHTNSDEARKELGGGSSRGKRKKETEKS